MQDFSGAEPLLDRPIAFHPCFMPVTTKCVVGALFLSQAWYWRTKGRKNNGWIYKTHYDFFEETGLSQKQQIRVRKILCTKPWWEEKVEKVNGVPTYHYRIDRIGLMTELNEISKELRNQVPDREFSENAQREFSENAQREFSENAQREFSENAQREFSLYKESENTNQRIQTENTHTLDPERVCEEIFEAQILQPDPDPIQPPSKTNHESIIPSSNSNSGEGENSGVCRTTETLSSTEYPEILSPADLAPVAVEIIDIYNRLKPEYWGRCTGNQPFIQRQIRSVIDRYRRDYSTMSEAIAAFKNDWGAANLACKASDFYNSATFTSGTIVWLLSPNTPERIPSLAQQWRDKPQAQQIGVAQKVAAAVGAIPRWDNPDVPLTGMMLSSMRTIYLAKYKAFLATGDRWYLLPDDDYLRQYFPEVFNQ